MSDVDAYARSAEARVLAVEPGEVSLAAMAVTNGGTPTSRAPGAVRLSAGSGATTALCPHRAEPG